MGLSLADINCSPMDFTAVITANSVVALSFGKKVIIATHDANIAVRTLPYNSIYRLHDQGQYFTLTGNPFSNSLKCIFDSRPELNWKEISMKTLEGGKEAFGERGKIYGN
jgi:hypothetical protein